MADELPRPTPEGKLIRQVRSLSIPKLSIPAAAARIGLSAEQWGYVERGYYPARDGNPPRPFSPPAATLAKMAHALRITPERLETEGQRPDAAENLREILRDQPQNDKPSLSDLANRPDLLGEIDEAIEKLREILRDQSDPSAIANKPDLPVQINETIKRLTKVKRLATIQRELEGGTINLEDEVERAIAAQRKKAPHIIALELLDWREWNESPKPG